MRRFERQAWQSIPIIPPGGVGEFFTFEQMRNRSIEALKGYIRRRIGGYRVARKDMPVTNQLYRGVRWNDRPPLLVAEVSYPKPDLIREFGARIASDSQCSTAAEAPRYYERGTA